MPDRIHLTIVFDRDMGEDALTHAAEAFAEQLTPILSGKSTPDAERRLDAWGYGLARVERVEVGI